MAIYHCSIKIISRSDGRSAVAAAAYRGGTKLTNEWDGITADYSNRNCVVHSEIILPANAPKKFSDRQTLWNSVEMNEKRGDAQLAREIEVALPKELPMEENIKLVKDYCQQFVDAGMCVDLNVHDKQDGNPHCHILLTMRALDENGDWLPKSHQEFDLDENGERVRLPNGRWKSHKVFTTDWDDHDKAEQWRVSWEETVNRYLEENKVSERIDHRSNVDRGIEELPTIHMGPTACAMEKKGIQTERGNINRMIRAANKTIREIGNTIRDLKDWLAEVKDAMKELLAKDSSPSLETLLLEYVTQEQQRLKKYSKRFQLKQSASDLVEVRDTIEKLNREGIYTADDLDRELNAVREKTFDTQHELTERSNRMKELEKLIDYGKVYQKYEPIRKELNGIRWQKKKDQYAEEHVAELTQWNAASRYLHAHKVNPVRLSNEMKEWKQEHHKLDTEYQKEYGKLKEERARVRELDSVHRQIQKVLSPTQKETKTKESNTKNRREV